MAHSELHDPAERGAGAACTLTTAQKRRLPLVTGSLSSLDGMKPGDLVRLDLSGKTLVGRRVGSVAPPICKVGGRPGALFVDTRDKSAWTKGQVEAWRRLDALEERLDFCEFEPNGNNWAGPVGLYESRARARKREERAAAEERKREQNEAARAERPS